MMMWRRTGPMTSKHRSRIRIEIPSGPQAPERIMENTTSRSSVSVTPATRKAQGPTRGKRHGTSGGTPRPARSAATRDPTFTKQVLSSSGVAAGRVAELLRLPAINGRTVRTTVQRAAPLGTQSLLNVRPAIAPDRRPHPPVKLAEGRRSPLTAQHAPSLSHQEGSPG